MNTKQKKTHEIISSVLNPRRFFGRKKDVVTNNFFSFLCGSSNDEFSRAIDILLKDEFIFSLLNQEKSLAKNIFKKDVIDSNYLTAERSIQLYKSIFSKQIKDLSYFIIAKEEVESKFLSGDYELVEKLILELETKLGDSIWLINLKFSLYTVKNQYDKINEFLEELKKLNDDHLFQDLIRVFGWKSQSVDSEIILESMVRRPNREFIEGDALDLAAFYSSFCLPFPLYDDVDLSNCIIWLQKLSLIDLYDILIKITISGIIKDTLSETIKNELHDLFKIINKSLNIEMISNILVSLKSDNNSEFYKDKNPDAQVKSYSEGKYNEIIDELEDNYQKTNNLITKVNIFAKSYIHCNRRPKGLPDLLNNIIENLISIYLLKDANQSIVQLINLSIKYSSLEISDHIIISVLKSAPYYFSTEQKNNITKKSDFITQQLTPLAYKLKNPSSLYLEKNNIDLPKHLFIKRKAIESIFKKSPDANINLEMYKSCSVIKKDFVELKIQYLISINEIKDLISYSAEELINNENSNICIPLEYIINYIDENCLYTVDSIICCYFYNKFSKDDNSTILNEVFEEYIVSLGVQRPSDIVNSDLDKKHIFFLKYISKIDTMDYLGSFDDDSDLKIERIIILNKLVSNGYIKQIEIDDECKDIVDDILIENEAAKFNDAKIFIDTRHIFNKRKNDIESILIKYSPEQNVEDDKVDRIFQIESMAILKGTKNELINRLINILLVEFMDNKEVGLDKNLSSEIRHGFFGNLMCSNLQKRRLITELDEKGNYSSNSYWIDYYHIVNKSILDEVDRILTKFSYDYNSLIENAEHWMKTSLNEEDDNRLFTFNFTVDDFDKIKSVLDSNGNVDDVANIIFKTFNEKLTRCLDSAKHRLNEEFTVEVDELFSKLIDELNENKQGTALSDLFKEIKLANTEVKEDIRTICEWFSFKKNIKFESFEIQKSVKLAEKCFKQINNCDINILIESNEHCIVDGKHLYALVFSMINCFSNCFKYSRNNNDIHVSITASRDNHFNVRISNLIDSTTRDILLHGKLSLLTLNLSQMNNHELLINEGGSGLYKSLHGLKMISKMYDLIPSISNDFFHVDINHGT